MSSWGWDDGRAQDGDFSEVFGFGQLVKRKECGLARSQPQFGSGPHLPKEGCEDMADVALLVRPMVKPPVPEVVEPLRPPAISTKPAGALSEISNSMVPPVSRLCLTLGGSKVLLKRYAYFCGPVGGGEGTYPCGGETGP